MFPVFYQESNLAHNLGKDSSDSRHCNGHIAATLASLLDSLPTVIFLWALHVPHSSPTSCQFLCTKLREWVNMKMQLYSRKQNKGPCPQLPKQILTMSENKIWVIANSTCSLIYRKITYSGLLFFISQIQCSDLKQW